MKYFYIGMIGFLSTFLPIWEMDGRADRVMIALGISTLLFLFDKSIERDVRSYIEED